MDGLQALNFVAEGALGGGVSRSLCLDNYGKSLSARVLSFELEIPERPSAAASRPCASLLFGSINLSSLRWRLPQ